MDSDDDQPYVLPRLPWCNVAATSVLTRCSRTLSAHALAALASFNAEKDEHAQKFEKLKAAAEADGPLSMEAFTEDWNESQFWVGSLRMPRVPMR